jgi:hypothetical protein
MGRIRNGIVESIDDFIKNTDGTFTLKLSSASGDIVFKMVKLSNDTHYHTSTNFRSGQLKMYKISNSPIPLTK